MRREDLLAVLEKVAANELPVEDAFEQLSHLPYLDLGEVKLDLHRELRSGLPEVVFGEGKTIDELLLSVEGLIGAGSGVLITRIDDAKSAALSARFSDARHHARARVWMWGEPPSGQGGGRVAVLSAGTSDAAVAEEAALCAEWSGLEVERHYDVGVAGVHRLLDRLAAVRGADAVIVVAGMDGALPTLVAGLVSSPVVAVPTSVGYGSSFDGLAALLTMLNGCAPGLAVVNIDNGYGAAVLAYRILGSRER